MSLRNTIRPTNRVTTDILINPSPATDSANNDSEYQVPACEPVPPPSRAARGIHWDVISFSHVLKKICTLGMPIHGNHERSTPRRRGKNIWCFQPRSEHHHAMDDDVWVAFERKNQRKLNEKFSNGSTTCDVQDRSIYGGEVTIKIMLRDGIGFIVDAEWQHVVYQIDLKPKMHWWQRVRYRALLKKKIKDNPLYAYV